MNKEKNKFENGQAILLIPIGVIVLFVIIMIIAMGNAA